MRVRNKPWARSFLSENGEAVTVVTLSNVPETIDLSALPSPIYLEIGSGKGDFLCTMASLFPSRTFIGIEQQPSVLALAVKKMQQIQGLQNLHWWNTNWEWVMDHWPSQSITAIYLNFVDPWPKLRHAKRRLTHPRFLNVFDRILVPHGRVYLKTDNEILYHYTQDILANSSWKVIEDTANYQLQSDDALTEYEAKFRLQGIPIKRIIMEKE